MSNKLLMCIAFFLCVATISCEDDKDTYNRQEEGTVTDIDGNTYRTVKIGDQWWMAENLKVRHYRNGQALTDLQSASVWNTDSAGYAQYDNNLSAPGLLYNWSAVNNSNGLAPAGWHIPTDEEWKHLEQYIGMSSSDAGRSGWRGTQEGNKLKVGGYEGWQKYNDNWPTNDFGFFALAGGCRLPDGRWSDPGLFATGYWWTATAKDSISSYYRYLDYKQSAVYRSADSKKYGFTIRCIKD